jgi:DNA-binding GntR family transcriptional regulator
MTEARGDAVPAPRSHEVSDGLPLRETIYLRLRDEIMSGRMPASQRLTEPKLSKQFGVSRTPIRDALIRLAADGLVQREDFGYSVLVPSLTQMRDLYELRLALELRGIRRAIENPSIAHDRAVLVNELATWEAMRAEPPAPSPEFVLLDESFHIALLSSSGNRELTEALHAVNSRIRRVRMYDFLEVERIEKSIAEHIAILEAVLDHRLDAALLLLHEHIGISLEVVMERATRAVTAMSLHRYDKD